MSVVDDLLSICFWSEKLEVLRHKCIIYTQDVMKGFLVARCKTAPMKIDSRTTEVLNVRDSY